jgi:hypothetical protein
MTERQPRQRLSGQSKDMSTTCVVPEGGQNSAIASVLAFSAKLHPVRQLRYVSERRLLFSRTELQYRNVDK